MQIKDSIHAFLWLNPSANNCNTYLINGTKRILVDPGHHHLFGHVSDRLSELSLSTEDIDVVIVTHGHPDHMEGVKIFAGTRTMIALHQAEMDFIREIAPHYGEALGIAGFEPDILLKEGNLHIGDMTFRVIDTPGHSPGSICLYWPDQKALFTGDLVFNQGLGRTDLPGGNSEILKASIKRISELNVDLLLPGHGDILTDPVLIKANFDEIERVWFAYL
jgi:glyoxylase-like metal-dependent hydrolase (beta-lactamase superfamily II)